MLPPDGMVRCGGRDCVLLSFFVEIWRHCCRFGLGLLGAFNADSWRVYFGLGRVCFWVKCLGVFNAHSRSVYFGLGVV